MSEERDLFEQNERWKGERILAALRSGRSVAVVSDAGTPGVSDPGFRLVRDARAEGLPVLPVPGPSAAVAALTHGGDAAAVDVAALRARLSDDGALLDYFDA